MNKLIVILFSIIISVTSMSAQKYFTRDGHVSFSSDSPLEKIKADNHKLNCVIDAETGKIQFAALIQAFHFEKALMQEHFNENYMESGKYPKASFSGQFTDWDSIDFSSREAVDVSVQGDMTIHGVTNPIRVTGKMLKKDGNFVATSTFDIQLADYDIDIPSVVKDNIAKTVQISVNLDLVPLEQK